jgi:uncharacterized protein DUF4157/D-alanyl-D-alanine carboxypeptidase-like protein
MKATLDARRPATPRLVAPSRRVQRCGRSDCPCTDEKGTAIRRSPGAAVTGGSVGEAVADVLGEPGRPLDPDTSRRFREGLGHDFSSVRVHDGSRAARSASLLSAHAWTAGQHVVFAPSRYASHTEEGSRLLAHELTHVAQQRGAGGRPAGLVIDDDPASEEEARRAAQAWVPADRYAEHAGHASSLPAASTSATAGIHRAPTDGATPLVDPGTPAADAGSTGTCALTTYTGSNFVGKTVTADVEFVDSLDAINAHAAANDVDVHVTSSFRTSTVVPGAIVTPATMSNHLAGHAIDMNVKYGPGKSSWCNSTCLGGALPAGVREFIAAVQADAGLRWGGDFTTKDPVHIDDGLNVNDAAAYTARYQATQQARTSGCG